MTHLSAELAWSLAAALAAGAVLGAMFFGGLRWTLARALGSPRAGAWIAAGMLARSALALAGFWLAGGADWRRLLACLAGFAFARRALLRRAPPREGAQGAAP